MNKNFYILFTLCLIVVLMPFICLLIPLKPKVCPMLEMETGALRCFAATTHAYYAHGNWVKEKDNVQRFIESGTHRNVFFTFENCIFIGK